MLLLWAMRSPRPTPATADEPPTRDGHGGALTWARLEAAAGCLVPPGAAIPREVREQVLVPWQTCEFVSAPARQWDRLPEPDRWRTGWTRRMSAPAGSRLTISVQSAPRWDPERPPPGRAAENSELFPPCVFTVAAGSAGCRMALEFWAILCREHGLSEAGGVPVFGAPTGNWRGFFRQETTAGGARCQPHALFADLDATVIGEVAARPLFSRAGLLHAGLDAACTAADAEGERGQELCGRAMAFMEAHSSEAGSPSLLLFFCSLEGSAGGGLGGEMLRRLRERFPTVPIVVCGVLPHARPTADSGVAWRSVLALRRIRDHASAALLFSNDSLVKRACSLWDTGDLSGYAASNLLIGEALAALTAPLRYGGRDAPAAAPAAWVESLGEGRAGWPPVVTAHVWPLAKLPFLKGRAPALPHVVAGAVRFALRQKCFAGGAAAIAVHLRGRWQEPEPDKASARRRRPRRPSPTLVPDGHLRPGSFESLTVTMSGAELEESCARIARRAASHLRRFPAALAAAGIQRAALRDAILALEARGAASRRPRRSVSSEPDADEVAPLELAFE